MKIKQFSIMNLISVALLSTGLTANIEQVSASHQNRDQVQLTEMHEVLKVIAKAPSNKTRADVINGINEGKFVCITPIPPHGKSIFFLALFNKNNEDIAQACVTQCIKLGNCLENIDTEGRNILHVAAVSTPEILKMVLANVPNVHTLLNNVNIEGDTPILQAIKNFRVDNTKTLKEAGANLNIKKGGMTPLDLVKHWKQSSGHSPNEELDKQIDQLITILSTGPKEKL